MLVRTTVCVPSKHSLANLGDEMWRNTWCTQTSKFRVEN